MNVSLKLFWIVEGLLEKFGFPLKRKEKRPHFSIHGEFGAVEFCVLSYGIDKIRFKTRQNVLATRVEHITALYDNCNFLTLDIRFCAQWIETFDANLKQLQVEFLCRREVRSF